MGLYSLRHLLFFNRNCVVAGTCMQQMVRLSLCRQLHTVTSQAICGAQTVTISLVSCRKTSRTLQTFTAHNKLAQKCHSSVDVSFPRSANRSVSRNTPSDRHKDGLAASHQYDDKPFHLVDNEQRKKRLQSNRGIAIVPEFLQECLGGLDNCRYLTTEEWDNFLIDGLFMNLVTPPKLYNSFVSYIAEENVYEFQEGFYQMARSLDDFIVETGILYSDLNMRSLRMLLLHHHRGEEAIDEIVSMYHDTRNKYPFMDSDSASNIAKALSKTPLWTEYPQLLEMIQLASKPKPALYSSLTLAALGHGDLTTAYGLMTTLGTMPVQSVVRQILNTNDINIVEHFLEFIGQQFWIPSTHPAMMIAVWFEKYYKDLKTPWNCEHFTTEKSTVCPHCETPVISMRLLSSSECQKLREAVLNSTLIGDDVYIRTTPELLEGFQAFLENHDRYDVVIDAMNVMNTTVRGSDMKHQKYMLFNTIRRFSSSGFHVLVLLPRKWKKHVTNNVDDRSVQFFYTRVANKGEDDALMIYGALSSGPDTYIVTQDELRDHCHLLPEDVRPLFRRWQLQRQIICLRTPSYKPRLMWPEKHQTSVQRTATGWHIPYKSSNHLESKSTNNEYHVQYYKPDNTWLCMSTKTM